MNFDTYAFIPIVATIALSAVLCVLLVIIKVKNTARVSYIMFLSLLVAILGLLKVLLRPFSNPVMTCAIVCFLVCLLFLPYTLVLCSFAKKPKQKKKKGSLQDEQDEDGQNQDTPQEGITIKPIQAKEIDLLEECKSFVTKAIACYGNKEGLQGMLDYVNKSVLETAKADGALVLLVDDFDDAITVRSFLGTFPPPYKLPDDMPHKPLRVETNLRHAQFSLHDNVFGEMALAGEDELVNDPKQDDRIFENTPEDFLKCGSYMFLPLKVENTVFGLIALAKKPESGGFEETDFENAKMLSSFASSAVKTVFAVQDVLQQSGVAKELEIASKMQVQLTATKLPPLAGATIGAFINSAPGVCGDYYDVMPARKDRIAFIMADVAGKGTKSMTVMIMIKAMLQLVINTTQTAATIMNWANRGLSAEPQSDHFASIALMLYNPVTHVLQLSSGGSVPVFLYSSAKQVIQKVPLSSDPLGIEKTTTYKDMQVSLSSGDIIITYTDGLMENQNEKGQQYSFESLSKVIKENATLSGKDIANKVKQDIKLFSGNAQIHDDQSFMVVKIQ